MKTYTVFIRFDITGKYYSPIEIDHVSANTPDKLDQLKDSIWGAMLTITDLQGWGDIENEGTMFIATDPNSDDCIFAKIYDDETGEEIDLD